jgi:hypothetical protein
MRSKIKVTNLQLRVLAEHEVPGCRGLGRAQLRAAREWGRRYGLTPRRRREWWGLLGRAALGNRCDLLAGDDHVLEFTRDRRVAVHVTQPYGLGAATLAAMERDAALHGLQFAVIDDEAGWWRPGHTAFAVWTRAGDPILDLIKGGAR